MKFTCKSIPSAHNTVGTSISSTEGIIKPSDIFCFPLVIRTLFKFMKKFEAVLDEPCQPALVEIGKEEQLDCLQKQEESENKETKVQRLNNTLRKLLSAKADGTKVRMSFIQNVGRDIFTVPISVLLFTDECRRMLCKSLSLWNISTSFWSVLCSLL